jgi:hypothetical protein
VNLTHPIDGGWLNLPFTTHLCGLHESTAVPLADALANLLINLIWRAACTINPDLHLKLINVLDIPSSICQL